MLIWWLSAEAVRGARALRAAAERGPGDLRVQLVQEPARLRLFTRTQRRITRLRRRQTRAGRATAHGRRGRRSTGARSPLPTARQAGRSGRRFRRLPAAPTPATLGRPHRVGLGRSLKRAPPLFRSARRASATDRERITSAIVPISLATFRPRLSNEMSPCSYRQQNVSMVVSESTPGAFWARALT